MSTKTDNGFVIGKNSIFKFAERGIKIKHKNVTLQKFSNSLGKILSSYIIGKKTRKQSPDYVIEIDEIFTICKFLD
jgi:hypothetical protein